MVLREDSCGFSLEIRGFSLVFDYFRPDFHTFLTRRLPTSTSPHLLQALRLGGQKLGGRQLGRRRLAQP